MAGSGFSIRASQYKESVLVNICDVELIGRTVTDGRLKMHISKEFFYGEVVDRTEAVRLMKTCSIINLAGQRSVGLAIENGIGAREAIREIEDVPFLIVYKFLH